MRPPTSAATIATRQGPAEALGGRVRASRARRRRGRSGRTTAAEPVEQPRPRPGPSRPAGRVASATESTGPVAGAAAADPESHLDRLAVGDQQSARGFRQAGRRLRAGRARHRDEPKLATVPGRDQRLRCRRTDDAFEVRKEFGARGRQRRRHRQHRLRALLPPARLERGRRLGRARDAVGEQRDHRPVRRNSARADPHVQCERSLTGDADVLADEPLGEHLEPRDRSAERRRKRHRPREDDLAFVAEIGQRSYGDPLRHRPVDRPQHRAGRYGRIELGRQSGITRIAPVGMPVRIMCEPQAEPERFARNGSRDVGDQFGLERIDPLRSGSRYLHRQRRRRCLGTGSRQDVGDPDSIQQQRQHRGRDQYADAPRR